jgi:hypothetical protein
LFEHDLFRCLADDRNYPDDVALHWVLPSDLEPRSGIRRNRRAELRVNTRGWLLSKGLRQKYGVPGSGTG